MSDHQLEFKSPGFDFDAKGLVRNRDGDRDRPAGASRPPLCFTSIRLFTELC